MDGHIGHSNKIVDVEGLDPAGGVALSLLKPGHEYGGTFVLHVKKPSTFSISGIHLSRVYSIIGFQEYQGCNVLDGKPPCYWLPLGSFDQPNDDHVINRAHQMARWAAENLTASVENLKKSLEEISGALPGSFPGLLGR